VADDVVPELVDRLDAAPLAATRATLGPAVTRLGRQVLVVPVDGLVALAAAVTEATADLGRPPDPRPFTGHVTLARARGRRGGAVPRSLTGTPIAEHWQVGDVRLVRSHLGSSGARYEDLHIRPLGP
jgi:RNA 2',3'-cyclic 3'-phosphodiesterase